MLECDGDEQLTEIASALAAQASEGREPLADGIRSRKVEAIPAIPEGRDATQRRIAVAADDDRNPSLPDRLGVDAHAIEADELSVKRGHILAPQDPHGIEVLVRAPAPSGEGDAERRELLARPADPHPERQPPAGQGIEARCLLGQKDRVVLGQQEDPRREPDPLGRRGDEAERHERIEPVGVGGDGNAPVARIRVRRVGLVHHHDVLTHPTGGKARRVR